jgi:glycosyltransferase involved in cell wall biosynthesis
MEKTYPIQILLACYNGEKYLREQLDSLLQQSEANFEILARDDASSDQTLAILKEYREKFPEKITLLPSKYRLGVIGNFDTLLEAASADYILFSDQDDVWLKNKVRLIYEALKEGEATWGKSTPLLVHTDLMVTDSKKNILHPSFWKYSRINPFRGKSLSRLLVQNTVTGCAMGINRALAHVAAPIPSDASMHDWWIALAAAFSGHIIPLREPSILYRQHENNTLGAKAPSFKRKIKNGFCFLMNPSLSLPEVQIMQRQAHALFEHLQESLSPAQADLLKTFLRAPKMTKMERKWTFIRKGFFRSGILKNFAYFFQDRPF